MGNAVPRMCHDAKVAPDGARSRSAGAAKAEGAILPCRVATARGRGGNTVRRRGIEEEQHDGGGGGASTVARVKLVLNRREAEKLIAQLENYGATERKARMAELKGQIMAAGSGSRTLEKWTPRLTPIKEN